MSREIKPKRGWSRPADIDGADMNYGGVPVEDSYIVPNPPCVFENCKTLARKNRQYCEAHLKQRERGKPLRPIFRKSDGKPTYQELLAVLTS